MWPETFCHLVWQEITLIEQPAILYSFLSLFRFVASCHQVLVLGFWFFWCIGCGLDRRGDFPLASAVFRPPKFSQFSPGFSLLQQLVGSVLMAF